MTSPEKKNAPQARGKRGVQEVTSTTVSNESVPEHGANLAHPSALVPFNQAAIPEALKGFPRWAPWRAEWNQKRGKWEKIPHRADRPEYGISTNKPEQWSPFAVALATLGHMPGKFAGLGYCLTGAHGVVGVDLDKCVGKGGAIEPWAAEIVAKLDSYTEISPSGTGLRIMGLGALAQDWNNHEVGIEAYGGNEARFLTITGAHVAGTSSELRRFDAGVLAELSAQYAKERRKAEVIDLSMPDILDDFLLPEIDKLPMPARAVQFLKSGEFDTDRSGTLHGAGVALYAAGLGDDEVFSILATNPHALEVALDHRRQDHDRALLYLWREHCCKARAKGQAAIVSADEFDVVAEPAPGEPPALPTFERDQASGKPKATKENITRALSRPDLCGHQLRWDTFRDEMMIAPAGRDEWRPFKDTDYHELCLQLERGAQGFKNIAKDKIRDAVAYVAEGNVFDSAQHWLALQEWDGKPRIESFLPAYFGAEDSPYTRAVGLYFWTALAGRVLEPGIKADMVPAAVGPQGAMKSSTVAAIVPAPDFFLELDLGSKDDDLARLMRGKLVIELGELKGLGVKAMEHVKAFITRQHEEWVPKFKEMNHRYARRGVFFATTNQDEFLTDETGNRRWLPFKAGRCNPDGVKADRGQLWAEAREVFKSRGVVWQDAERLGRNEHDAYIVRDAWEQIIRAWLDTPDHLSGQAPSARDFVKTCEVLTEALQFSARNITRREEMRVGAVLRKLGYVRERRQIDGGARAYVYARVPTLPYLCPT